MATVLTSHGMSSPEPQAAAASSTAPKALWIAVGVLAVAAAAMGGALVMKSTGDKPATPATQASALPMVAPADGTPEKPVVQQAQPQPQAHAAAAKPAPAKKPVQQPAQHQVAQGSGAQPAHAICASCGTVQSVQPVQVKGEGSGVGVVGGAVAGGLLGHQVGGGNGKTALTVLGAVGGALAGNEVEKRVRSTTAYDVQVRMEDGSTRTVRQSQPITAGTKVQVDANGALRVAGAN